MFDTIGAGAIFGRGLPTGVVGKELNTIPMFDCASKTRINESPLETEGPALEEPMLDSAGTGDNGAKGFGDNGAKGPGDNGLPTGAEGAGLELRTPPALFKGALVNGVLTAFCKD